MSEAEWRIRVGTPADRDLLGSFSCADPAVGYEAEVEQFVRNQLTDWAFAPGASVDDPRLLLAAVTATGELFGVAAHERTRLRDPGGAAYNATKIEVVALAAPWQGRRFSTGARASDVLLSAVMTDIVNRVPPRDARVFAVVHTENQRSLALLSRHGLTEEMSSPYPGYRRIVTPLATADPHETS